MELLLNTLLKGVVEGLIVGLFVTVITKGAKVVGSHLLIHIRERKNSRKNREDLHKRE